MLHTALDQVAPTLLLSPWSHDLSLGPRTIHSPFPDPYNTDMLTLQRDKQEALWSTNVQIKKQEIAFSL